jgi:hypothetical protein
MTPLKDPVPTGVFHAKSLILTLDAFLPKRLLSTDAGTDAYTKTSRKTTSIIVSPFPHEAAPSPAASAMYLANFVSSTLKQASILLILPCKRSTNVKPSHIEIRWGKEVVALVSTTLYTYTSS